MVMAGFTESAFVKKLLDLNNSSQSIQTLSLWLIHHRKHHEPVVKIWLRELLKTKETKKLTFMYLANDVIQNSRKKGPEYGKEFANVLTKAFDHLVEIGCDEKTRNSLRRLLTIWGERGIYDENQIAEFGKSLVLLEEEPPSKKHKVHPPEKKEKKSKNHSSDERERKKSENEVDGITETHVHLSPRTPANDPPEPEELIRVMQDLESNTASADEVVRQQIAQLPREVSEVSLVSNIQDRTTAENLSKQVNDAVTLLNDYNNRLGNEVELRKKITNMLRDFLIAQKELLAQAEQGLEEYQEKLHKVHAVRQELKSHIQNLPDLTQLPDVTGGLAPLPSAGDLFNIH
ncbi:regulation of nuclear pre-mRNA domain-containing protein 1B isoform X2 [Agrilus planipennis]|uniref:Regulation of nuclear pre-mRNA domain-containing protein 1B isoform X2 n=1 Tax=Agrilus planipennis TaxID=224129 RepID=A0A7F5RLB1_AGRPL|nr:regulation of nuclear pre-mRNA domain-containing protein 1B isoform X2 [Agrilus planipennis]